MCAGQLMHSETRWCQAFVGHHWYESLFSFELNVQMPLLFISDLVYFCGIGGLCLGTAG